MLHDFLRLEWGLRIDHSASFIYSPGYPRMNPGLAGISFLRFSCCSDEEWERAVLLLFQASESQGHGDLLQFFALCLVRVAIRKVAR